jgi:Right handed beta helix region
MKKYAVVVLALAGWAGGLGTRVAAAAVLRVRAGETIQAAIDRASYGDTVLVEAGRYEEDVRLPGGITLRAQDGWGATEIAGTGNGPVVLCDGPGDREIAGFTITGGPASAAAIRAEVLQDGQVIVRDNRITDNAGDGIAAVVWSSEGAFVAENNILDGNGGRGIAADVAFARARLADNRIDDNARGGLWLSATEAAEIIASRNEVADNLADDGAGIGGLAADGGALRLVGNRVVWNRAFQSAGIHVVVSGGTLDLWNNDVHRNLAFDAFGGVNVSAREGGQVALVNNTIVANEAPASGGVTIDTDTSGTARVVNCLLWGNTAPDLQGATATHSAVGTGATEGEGNVGAAPHFLDPDNDDYRLCLHSPGVDAGENAAVPAELALDAEGNARIVGPAVDCGAYETAPATERLQALRVRIDALAASRQIQARVANTLRYRINSASASLRQNNRSSAAWALYHVRAMAQRVREEAGEGIASEAADPLLQTIESITHQLEHCGG